VAAFLFPPHPVSGMTALRATHARTSGRFIWSPDVDAPPLRFGAQGLK
jgi:hypothetical protein